VNQLQEVTVILCLTIGLVIIINVGIIAVFRRNPGARAKSYKTIGKALKIARDPWEDENKQLDELSNLIESIQEKPEQNESN
jgi:hypothetical protein